MNDARLSPDRDEDRDADIAVGCFAALCRDRLADRLLSLSRAAPRATVGVHELALAELLPRVRDGRVALAVAPADAPGGAGLASMTLWQERALVAMAAGHPLAAMPELVPDALLDTVTLLSTDGAEGEMQRYLLARLFAGVRPPLDARPGRGGDLMTRVAAGDGVALVLAGRGVATGVVTRPIAAAAGTVEVRVWWRADHDSPTLTALLRLLAGAA